jgi:hypothetical protein
MADRARSAVERIIEHRAEQSARDRARFLEDAAKVKISTSERATSDHSAVDRILERTADQSAADGANAAQPKTSPSEKAARAAKETERKRVKREKRLAKDEKQAAARREAMNRVWLPTYESFIYDRSLTKDDFIDRTHRHGIRNHEEGTGGEGSGDEQEQVRSLPRLKTTPPETKR